MRYTFILLILSIFACKDVQVDNSKDTQVVNTGKQEFEIIPKLTNEIIIDGEVGEQEWAGGDWYFFDNVWLGDTLEPTDFKGRYKMKYDEKYIYVLAQTYDDTLVDTHQDGLVQYWDDDCLEIFIDENNSKGNHQYNHNAFAYHIALDGKIVDIGLDSMPRYYDHHIVHARKTFGLYTVWEMAMSLYDDTYDDEGTNRPVKLTQGKEVGFMIAYCDNDHSETREHFIGSETVEGEDKNRGWIDAGIFGNFVLE